MMKKNKKMLVVLFAVVVILLAVLLILRKEEPVSTDIAVETPVCTVYFPAYWQEQIRTEVDQAENITVSFHGKISENKEAHLFDIIFGEPDTGFLGSVKAKNKEIYKVGVRMYEPDRTVIQTDAEMYLFDSMQEDLNYLIARLPLEGQEHMSVPKDSVAVVQTKREQVHADVIVDTPYGPIVYSGELAGALYLDIREEAPYTITFNWNHGDTAVPLYELAFGSAEGTLMGYLPSTGDPVFLTVFDVMMDDTLSQEEQISALSAQESLNDVIANLQLQSEGGSWIQQETPYGVLCYPEEYRQSLRITTEEAEAYQVSYLFVRENGEEKPLFDVIFGGTEGVPVGTCTGVDGAEVPVYLNGYEPAFDGTWSSEEQEQYYIMAEGINALLEKYAAMYPFEFA